MLHPEKPENFIPDMQVSEWILEYEWKILIVQRSAHCSSPLTWSGPGGKLETWESFGTALIRELEEEIWVDISKYKKDKGFKKYFYFLWKNIEIQFYKIFCETLPEIILNDEHQDYLWVEPRDALTMNLTEDFDLILEEMYSL